MSEIINTNDEDFEKDIAAGAVLVDFWAEWCGPCKMVGPILVDLAEEYDGQLQIVKLDIDGNELTGPKFGVRGIPTLMIFQNGELKGTKVGALSKSQLKDFIDNNL